MAIPHPLKSALLKAAGTSTLLMGATLVGCSGQVKVQKVVYDAPEARCANATRAIG